MTKITTERIPHAGDTVWYIPEDALEPDPPPAHLEAGIYAVRADDDPHSDVRVFVAVGNRLITVEQWVPYGEAGGCWRWPASDLAASAVGGEAKGIV